MPHRKIATCCYCGSRAALVLTGTRRHELSCASCGAPLHDLKMLRADHVRDGGRVKPSPLHRWEDERPLPDRPARPPRPKRRGKRGGRRLFGGAANILEEAFDLIEDIFD